MMTIDQVWGACLIFVVCPILGGLPLVDWIVQAVTGRSLKQLGTGNISVSAAFYHGGRGAGILAVISEAAKGIAAVLLARQFFPSAPEWELVALMALVIGRYWVGKGAGTTNVTWGYAVHDPIAALLVFVIGAVSFMIQRDRLASKYSILIIFPLITALLHSRDTELMLSAIVLAGLLWWIYQKIPDDLQLPTESGKEGARSMMQVLKKDDLKYSSICSIEDTLQSDTVGAKAATLSELKRCQYPVPNGWVVLPGDDPTALIEYLTPSQEQPLVVRSSAIGEDSLTASAAGQYLSILNVTSRSALESAIVRCLESYDSAAAARYRQERGVGDQAIAVLIQPQIAGIYSGVAFSRDPIVGHGEAIVIEAVAGDATQVVSGKITPQRYRIVGDDIPADSIIPADVLQQVIQLTRQLEQHYQGIPQDIEWTHDGQQLWLLQARPITTLQPLWTRKIAAEVIPGAIHPLTWSINRPLTCGVWGEIFTIVLGDRAQSLDFTETATLHFSHAYFNATLLGEIFHRMGLPKESLEFLTHGAKFTKPPLMATVKNIPGLMRLLGREIRLVRDFQNGNQTFARAIAEFTAHPPESLESSVLLDRIQTLQPLLKKATYYSILAPLSAALRQAIFRVPTDRLDLSQSPEIESLRSLQDIATMAKPLLSNSDDVFEQLARSPEGQAILQQVESVCDRYGYLSEVGTDIAVPTWREDPKVVRSLFASLCRSPKPPSPTLGRSPRWVQSQFNVKGQVTEVYSRLLAELRWCFVALGKQWQDLGWIDDANDIFLFTIDEIQQRLQLSESGMQLVNAPSRSHIQQRKLDLQRDREFSQVPYLVYGQTPMPLTEPDRPPEGTLQGIGVSPGIVEGRVKRVRSLVDAENIDRSTIVIVPYTDSGWMPVLAQAGGLIAEVGGQLSHGAIVAREYGIPAVMNVAGAMQLLDGAQVRIDGHRGTVERC